jgi:hypothetical protein
MPKPRDEGGKGPGFFLPSPSQLFAMRITDIVNELKEMHSKLAALEQEAFDDSHREQLTPIAKGLIADGLLQHSDRTVRLLSACCIAQILRLFAPDAPYSSIQLDTFFSIVLLQMRHLTDTRNPYHNYIFCLAESLATYKSILLLLEVPDGGEAHFLSLLRLSLDFATQPGFSASPVRAHLLEMLQALILEASDSSFTSTTGNNTSSTSNAIFGASNISRSNAIIKLLVKNSLPDERLESIRFVSEIIHLSPIPIAHSLLSIHQSAYLSHIPSHLTLTSASTKSSSLKHSSAAAASKNFKSSLQ